MTRKLAWLFILIGFGIALHDYAHQVWELHGFHNLLEGGYIGFALLLLGLLILRFSTIRTALHWLAIKLKNVFRST